MDFENTLGSFGEAQSPEEIYGALTEMLASIPAIGALIVIGVCLLLAFFSYKIFKFCLVLAGAVGGFFLGSTLISPIMSAYLNIEMEYLPIIVGVVCAVILGILAIALHKLFIFLSGAAAGWLLLSGVAYMLAEMIYDAAGGLPIDESVLSLLLTGVFAIIIGLITVWLFKVLYIITTSLANAISAAFIAAFTWLSDMMPTSVYIALGVGAVIGVFAMIAQFKMNSSSRGRDSRSSRSSGGSSSGGAYGGGYGGGASTRPRSSTEGTYRSSGASSYGRTYGGSSSSSKNNYGKYGR